MPYSDPMTQRQNDRAKWDLWNELRDGHAEEAVCQHCDLPIFAVSEERFTVTPRRWYHFVDPVALGIRPLGKNDPVYDFVRQCVTALRHRFIPEGFEDHDGNIQGLDPRVGSSRDLAVLLQSRLDQLTTRHIATPHDS